MTELRTEILIAGAGLGGVAAALSALRLGRQVILVEESDWIGGQLTGQGVPPDEHPWIETTGCTATYRRLRNLIRDFYRRAYPLKPEVSADPKFNPGMGNVSPLCHEPRVALAVLQEMLAPYRADGQLILRLHYRPVEAETEGDRIVAVHFRNDVTGETLIVHAAYVLDATELGELLPLAGVEHVIGAESQEQTGEPNALPGLPNPLDQQAFSWCFAMDYLPDSDHTITKPDDYEFWRNYQADFWPDRQLSWTYSDPMTHQPMTRFLFAGPTDDPVGVDLWHFRRIFYRGHYPPGRYASDVVLVNWSQIDYWLHPLVGVSDTVRQQALRGARQLSLSMLYWMQTEAPRPEGGYGYPGLRLRDDVFGTEHGLARSAYVRESRRILAEFTVSEQHIGMDARGSRHGAEQFEDSVGLGSYRIDLHPSTAGRNFIDIATWPFQIPLRSLLPVRMENLLPACKNLGVTHITNGCFRLHPVEWNIGEAAGALAAFCLTRGAVPRQVGNQRELLRDFQQVLCDLGAELAWPEPIRLMPRVKLDPMGF